MGKGTSLFSLFHSFRDSKRAVATFFFRSGLHGCGFSFFFQRDAAKQTRSVVEGPPPPLLSVHFCFIIQCLIAKVPFSFLFPMILNGAGPSFSLSPIFVTLIYLVSPPMLGDCIVSRISVPSSFGQGSKHDIFFPVAAEIRSGSGL